MHGKNKSTNTHALAQFLANFPVRWQTFCNTEIPQSQHTPQRPVKEHNTDYFGSMSQIENHFLFEKTFEGSITPLSRKNKWPYFSLTRSKVGNRRKFKCLHLDASLLRFLCQSTWKHTNQDDIFLRRGEARLCKRAGEFWWNSCMASAFVGQNGHHCAHLETFPGSSSLC